MKRTKKALLIALALGDGHVSRDKRGNRNAALELHHSTKQLDYLKHKRDILHSLIGGKEIPLTFREQKGKNGSIYKLCRVRKTHRYFNVLQRLMYPNKYSRDVLKYLTPQALAIWFMDDGTHLRHGKARKDGTWSSENRLFICTTKEIAEEVCSYFEEVWGIKWRLYKHRGYYSIRCGHKEGQKFHDLIHPYVIPSMAYKQRLYYDTSA